MLQGIEKFINHIDGHAHDTGGVGTIRQCRAPGVYWQLSSCRIAVQYYTPESELTSFQMCQIIVTCTYVLSLVCLGIVRVYSVLLIASLGIHMVENPVSSQGAFVCPGCRPHTSAQALRVAEGHLCLCRCGSRERVYKGQISLIFSHDVNRLWEDTSANCLVLGICALFLDRTDICILVIHAPIHAVSSRSSA